MVQGRFLIVCLFVTVMTLIGCTPNANYRGKHVTKESLQTLQLGVHTKPDVRSILGSPSSIYTLAHDILTNYVVRKRSRSKGKPKTRKKTFRQEDCQKQQPYL